MLRNRRAAMSTVFFAAIVALTGSLVLFLGSAAQAAGRPSSVATSHGATAKAHRAKVKVKVPSPLSELLASDAWPGDDFGWSVSVSGSTAVVGAPYADGYTGAAYVFSDVAGSWIQVAELVASDDATSDRFGWSVNISGSTIVVGAPGHYYGIGSAYVFTGSGAIWTQVAELTASDAAGGDKFGYSVVTSGSTVMVGADNHNGGAGAVYVYGDVNGTWSQEQELTASDGAPYDEFGWSMGLSGTTLVVSAVRHDDNGAIYVFTDAAGGWSQQAELTASDGADNDYFGDKVATNGTEIVAGAPGHGDEQGAAYIFTGSAASWTQVAEVKASDGSAHDCFGWAVGLSGKMILVGAEQTNNDSGAAYMFQKKGKKWVQKDELTDTPGGPAAEFGYSASLSGTTAIISADGAEADAGSAFIYTL